MEEQVRQYVEYYRNHVEPCWDDKTISPKFLPIDTAKPRSAGQCASTSIYLQDELGRLFPHEKFTAAIGQVFWLDKHFNVAIDFHVWVQWHREPYKGTWIIDATPDQGEGITDRFIVDEIKNLVTEKGLVYQAYVSLHDRTDNKPEVLQRVEILKERMSHHERQDKV